MPNLYNIYCDESCHLEHDHQPVMVLGALWSAADRIPEISRRVKDIKADHGLAPGFEAKWIKVSPAKLSFYRSLVDYFFDDDDLHFRALIAPKTNLQHAAFGQDHETWYYKMYFELLKFILSPDGRYRVYLDIKDTRSADRVRTLHDVLANNLYDFDRRIVERVQTVRSHEVAALQLVDVLVGAVSHANRPGGASPAKQTLVERIRERSGYNLTRSTLLGERKVNLFHWMPRSAP